MGIFAASTNLRSHFRHEGIQIPMPKSWKQLREEFNQTGYDFLMADLESGLAFARRALGLNVGPEVRRRNVINTRKAYDTVTRLQHKFRLDSEQQSAFDEKRTILKNALEQLGERISSK